MKTVSCYLFVGVSELHESLKERIVSTVIGQNLEHNVYLCTKEVYDTEAHTV